ncbi:MAG: hypothetical protein U5L04_11030 [Trueperaceae bacterium]|nr:hypothetical protein [Trueperaceae bacterium]
MRRTPAWLRLYGVLAFVFLYAPIVVIAVYSFNASRIGVVWTGFTFEWYRTLFANETILLATRNTLLIAVVSTVVSTLFGTLLGLGMARYVFTGKRVFLWVMYVPVVIPELIMAVSLILFYSLLSSQSGALADTFSAWQEGAAPPVAAAVRRPCGGVRRGGRLFSARPADHHHLAHHVSDSVRRYRDP